MSSATSSLADFIENSPKVVEKVSKKAAKVSSKAAKAAKKIIESFTQSDSKLTETFTDHSITTVTEKVSNVTMVLTKAKDLLNNPKIKWVFLAILLCVAAFLYFRMQKKQSDKKPKEEHNLNTINDHNGQPELISLPPPPVYHQAPPQQAPQPQIDMMAVERALRERIENEMREKMTQDTNKRKPPVPDSESSDEVFIEDENVLNHNLTAEEMNAIDRQLEDVNLDNLMNN